MALDDERGRPTTRQSRWPLCSYHTVAGVVASRRRSRCQRWWVPVTALSSDWIDDQVHELAVEELLERQGPQRPEPFAVEAEGDDGQSELSSREDQPRQQDGPGAARAERYSAHRSATGPSRGSSDLEDHA